MKLIGKNRANNYLAITFNCENLDPNEITVKILDSGDLKYHLDSSIENGFLHAIISLEGNTISSNKLWIEISCKEEMVYLNSFSISALAKLPETSSMISNSSYQQLNLDPGGEDEYSNVVNNMPEIKIDGSEIIRLSNRILGEGKNEYSKS